MVYVLVPVPGWYVKIPYYVVCSMRMRRVFLLQIDEGKRKVLFALLHSCSHSHSHAAVHGAIHLPHSHLHSDTWKHHCAFTCFSPPIFIRIHIAHTANMGS